MAEASRQRPDLFTFVDYRRYLTALCDFLKETTAYFSYRYLSKRANFSSPNYPKLVVDGKRNLTKKSLHPLMKALGLNGSEEIYFEHLVFFNQAKTSEEKEFFYKKLLQLKRGPSVHVLSKDQYDYFSNWYTPAVRELLTAPAHGASPAKIGQALVPAVSAAKVRRSIALLERLGLVRRQSDGAFTLTDAAVSTGPEVGSLAAFKYHDRAISLGGEALRRFKGPDRHLRGMTLGLSKKGFDLVKERMEALIQDLHKIAAEEKTMDRVYMLNLQMFPVSRADR